LHIVYFPQLLSRFWGFGGSGRLYNDGMSFQLGAPQLALALAGIWMCRKQRFFQASAAAYVILVVLMTPVALWLWRNVGVLRTMQFPWRILAITASLQLGCAAGIGYRLARSSTRGRALLVYGVLLGASLAWQSNQFAVQPVRDVRKELDLYNQDGRLSTMTNYAGVEEFLPRTAAYPSPLDPRGDNIPIVQPPPPASAGPLPDSTPYRIHYDVTAPVASEVIVNQLYFPGWRVTVDDQPISANVLRSSLLPDGRMVVPIPAGHHTLGARYAGPPGAGIYVALIVVVFGAVLLLWIAERRRPRLS
jgi:hypothetical protein